MYAVSIAKSKHFHTYILHTYILFLLFSETIQRGCQQPLLLTSTILPPPPPNHETELSFSQFPTAINGERSTLLVTTSSHSHHHDIECSSSKRFEVEKLSSCCRYRKPAIVSLFSVGLILIITFLVLYWNYHETVHRRMTKKKVSQCSVASLPPKKVYLKFEIY